MKKVTIMIPCYNQEKYIQRCLDSCINQTYKNIEILIVNDGSIDKSKDIIESYIQNYVNITLINQDNKGISTTRNVLLKNTKTEFGFFLDADDWLEPDCIEFFIKNHIDEDMILNSCFLTKKNKSKSFFLTNKINQNTNSEMYLIQNNNFTWNILFKIDYFKNNNFYFYDKYNFFEDVGLMSYVIYKTKKIKFLNNPKYHYYVNKSSLSRSCFTKEKINSAIGQLGYLYFWIKQEKLNKLPKSLNDQLAFYHCVVFTYIAFLSKLKRKDKKELKSKLKKLEKQNYKLRFPKRYWKFWYFVLYRMFGY